MKTTEICAIKHINRIFMTGLMGICFTISIQAQTGEIGKCRGILQVQPLL